jgi:hypothetical protein
LRFSDQKRDDDEAIVWRGSQPRESGRVKHPLNKNYRRRTMPNGFVTQLVQVSGNPNWQKELEDKVNTPPGDGLALFSTFHVPNKADGGSIILVWRPKA